MPETKQQTLESSEALQRMQAEEKLKHDLALLEAALYVSGRPLDLNELCSVLKTRSKNKTRRLVRMLMQEYAKRNTVLEILELKDERFVLQLKAEYTPHVRKLVNRPLLSTGPLKTLSYIAYKQPISQKRVIEVRGRHVYSHIRMLKEMNLISAERKGRVTLLRTTDYFADYFGLSHDIQTMKKELKNVFEDFSKQEKSANFNG